VSGTEIAVIGGGVIGCSIAYHLAKRGARVTLIERDQLAAHASGASAGGVRQLGRDPREMPLAIRSIARWHTLETELDADVEFRMGGQLYVAEDEEDIPLLKQKEADQRAQGLDIRFVEGAELRSLAPHLAPAVRWALFTDNDGQASAPLTTRAFAAAAQRLGARILTETTVTAIVRESDRVTGLETTAGKIACDWLALTAGAWSPALAAQLDLSLPIETMGLQMFSAGPAAPMLAQTVGAVRRRLSLKQVPNGNFVIGGGWPGDVSLETKIGTTRLESIQGSIEHASAILPALKRLPLIRAWIGLEALTIDEVPILGPIPTASNATIATGFSGHGFALSPIVGQLLSDRRFAALPAGTPFPDWQAG
jgi:sarcosine oxidase subunit beta